MEQFWHLGSPEARTRLILEEPAELEPSWRSTTFGEKHRASIVRVHRRCALPLRLRARIELNP